MPHGRAGGEGWILGARGGDDRGPHPVRRVRARTLRESGARAARRGSPGWPHRPGTRGRRGDGYAGRAAWGRLGVRSAGARRGAAGVDSTGRDYGGRGESHHQRAAGKGPRADLADPVHAGAHDAWNARRGGPRSRGGRHAREVREGTMQHGKIKQAIAAIRAGKLVIVADDENRENEGDLVGAAEQVTPEMVNFMATHARGLICVTLLPERCQALGLTQMAEHNTEAHETAFTVSIDAAARFGVTTGISAADRAATIRVAVDPVTVPTDLRRPGHVFPLRARPGGVLQRVGQTEASLDLARLAGLYPAGVICEILNPDGSMARQPELEQFAARHGLTFITVAQLVAYRLAHERLVHRVAEARLPTPFGEFRIVGYRNDVDAAEHVALVYGDVQDRKNVLVRMHAKCLTGDVFGSGASACRRQVHS